MKGSQWRASNYFGFLMSRACFILSYVKFKHYFQAKKKSEIEKNS